MNPTVSSLQEVHRSHATLYPLLLENSIASPLQTSKWSRLKSAVLREMDTFLREEGLNLVKPALVCKKLMSLCWYI